MKNFNVEKIKKDIESKTGEVSNIYPADSEHFTKEIVFDIEDNAIIIGAFVTEGEIDEDGDDIEFVYVFDNSGRGCESKDKNVRNLYNQIKDYLLVDLGYEVVDTYDGFF